MGHTPPRRSDHAPPGRLHVMSASHSSCNLRRPSSQSKACAGASRSEEVPLPTLSRRARERDQGGKAHDRELDPQEWGSLCSAAMAIANEVVQGTPSSLGLGAPLRHALVIDGRAQGAIPVLSSSRAAQLLKKDPRSFGATVKQLYLSGQAGGAGLRELLAHTESMETDQPEFNPGRPAPASASGSAAPTFGRGARDAAG